MASQGGGAGGMDWVELGKAIQDDAIESSEFLMGVQERLNKRRDEEKKRIEQKRQFGETIKRTDRSQNLQALDFLSNKIGSAQTAANRVGGDGFKRDFSRALRTM